MTLPRVWADLFDFSFRFAFFHSKVWCRWYKKSMLRLMWYDHSAPPNNPGTFSAITFPFSPAAVLIIENILDSFFGKATYWWAHSTQKRKRDFDVSIYWDIVEHTELPLLGLYYESDNTNNCCISNFNWWSYYAVASRLGWLWKGHLVDSSMQLEKSAESSDHAISPLRVLYQNLSARRCWGWHDAWRC